MRAQFGRLRAGRFDAVIDSGALRWIRFDGSEILRSMQVTVRDRSWGTVAPVIDDVRVTGDATSFEVAFAARYEAPDLGVACSVGFHATPAELSASLECRATRPTWHQRLGLLVLHPPQLAGRSLLAVTPAGTAEVVAPTHLTADTVASDLLRLQWEPADGCRATLRFEGSLWEMEDQRNWSDASFKTYCPPLRLPHPVLLEEGASFRQRVTLAVVPQAGPRARPRRRSPAVVMMESGEGVPLPSIGLARPTATRLAPRPVIERLRRLHPGHLRVVLDLESPDWRAELDAAAAETRQIGARMELEVSAPIVGPLTRDCASRLASLPRGTLDRVLAFPSAPGLVTTDEALSCWRSALAEVGISAPVGGGTRANFAELSRTGWPLADRLETACVCITPQIHAFDRRSIAETLLAQSLIARDMVFRYGARPISILCTLRPRFNAYSEPPERGPSPGRIDPRLGSPFAAAWTVGSLQALARPGLAAITYHETVGPAGILGLQPNQGREIIEHPVYRVLCDVLADPGSQVVPATYPELCPALVLLSEERVRVLLANLDDRPRLVDVSLPPARRISVHWLARADPAGLGAEGVSAADLSFRRGAIPTIRVRLLPDEVVRVDGSVDGRPRCSSGVRTGVLPEDMRRP
jgi:D-apionolactonase